MTTITRAETLPAVGTWTIDPTHSTVGFVARHLMVTKVRGRFADVAGVVEVAEVPEESTVNVTIQTASIDTRNDDRDNHLRSPDFFDAEHHPTITFRSTGVRGSGDSWQLDGELTIKGITRPVSLDVSFEGVVDDPWGGQRAGFSASGELDRDDWGLTWNVALESGGVVVGKKVKLEIEAQLVRG
jgi:polyisoprenoid-binding protein YceI